MNHNEERLVDWLKLTSAQAEHGAAASSFPHVSGDRAEAAKRAHIAAISSAICKAAAPREGLARLLPAQVSHPWVARFAAAAVLALVTAGAWRLGQGQSSVVKSTLAAQQQSVGGSLSQVVGKVLATRANGEDMVVAEDVVVADGDELSTTADAFASLEFGEGVRVDLASATIVKLQRTEARHQSLSLRAGRVDINVPQLPKGESRSVEVSTPDSRVVVRGTIFSVEVVSESTGTITLVGVSRGAVSVFHDGSEHQVEAGERWSSKGGLSLEKAEGEPGVAAVVAPNTEPASSRPTGRSLKTTLKVAAADKEPEELAAASSLTRQNRFFELGVEARNSGNDKRAQFWFARLLSKFPKSPLRESAQRELTAANERLSH